MKTDNTKIVPVESDRNGWQSEVDCGAMTLSNQRFAEAFRERLERKAGYRLKQGL
jgi:hypothetical protein